MRRALKWLGLGTVSLFTVAMLLAGGLAAYGRFQLSAPYHVTGLITSGPPDSLTIARGEHVAQIHRCHDCHGPGLRGALLFDIPPLRLTAPNLTRGHGGIGAEYTDQDWDRAIRHGLRPTGRPLIGVMPYDLFNRLSDPDAGALIAYLKALPPADTDLPTTQVRLLGYVLLGLRSSQFLRPPLTTPASQAPEPGPTAAYGKYLTSTVCVECHGAALRGGRHPSGEGPVAPALAAAGTWPLSDFARAVRTGIAPGGRVLTRYMPAKGILEHLSDLEIEALYAYLKTLATPSRAHAAG
jgi:mono/diheme cytochrome c family protein